MVRRKTLLHFHFMYRLRNALVFELFLFTQYALVQKIDDSRLWLVHVVRVDELLSYLRKKLSLQISGMHWFVAGKQFVSWKCTTGN